MISRIYRILGFSLIEVLIALAIVGILAAIAYPSYQKYILEIKLIDVLEYADSAKLAITEFYQETGECPTVKNVGLTENHPIPHIDNVSSAFDAKPCKNWVEFYFTLDGDSEPGLKNYDGDRIMMRGEFTGSRQMIWKCGFSRYTPEVRKILPASCQHELI